MIGVAEPTARGLLGSYRWRGWRGASRENWLPSRENGKKEE